MNSKKKGVSGQSDGSKEEAFTRFLILLPDLVSSVNPELVLRLSSIADTWTDVAKEGSTAKGSTELSVVCCCKTVRRGLLMPTKHRIPGMFSAKKGFKVRSNQRLRAATKSACNLTFVEITLLVCNMPSQVTSSMCGATSSTKASNSLCMASCKGLVNSRW